MDRAILSVQHWSAVMKGEDASIRQHSENYSSMRYDRKFADKYAEFDGVFAKSLDYKRICDAIEEGVKGIENPSVLDFGCGTLRYIDCIGRFKEYVGVDISLEMLRHARMKTQNMQDKVIFYRGGQDILQSFESKRFEFIFSIGVIAEYVPLEVSLLKELRRLVKPNGRILISMVLERGACTSSWKARIYRRFRPLINLLISGKMRARYFLHEVSEASFRVTARRAGLEVDSVHMLKHHDWPGTHLLAIMSRGNSGHCSD